MACPSLLFTSGTSVWGLGTWDGGTKISLRLTSNVIATYSYPGFSFLYSTSLPGTIPSYSGTIINMAVDDDGYAYMWVRTTGSFYRLVKHDIAAGTSTIIHTSIYSNAANLAGPSWNPNDGYLYEVVDDFTGLYQLRRWDTSTGSDTTVAYFTRMFAFAVANMLVFTPDGTIWVEIEDGTGSGYTHMVRYDGSEATTSLGTDFNLRVPVPRTRSSVWASHSSGLIVNADGSTAATDCSLFSTSGTARVHCGATGHISFLYPTSGGVGTDVYGHYIPPSTGRWRVGRIGWPS